jgi:hypothetical protein
MRFEIGYLRLNDPLYGRRDKDGVVVLGVRVEERHVNPLKHLPWRHADDRGRQGAGRHRLVRRRRARHIRLSWTSA